jgi:hypothetical protein
MSRTLFAPVLLAAAMLAAPAQAQLNVEQYQGTWECFGPGQTHPKKPPIMYFGAVKQDEKGVAAVEVDGFSRAVAGHAGVAADADGWLKVTPASGSALYVRGYRDAGKRVSMDLRRDGVGNYRCYRLPKYDNVMIPRDRIIEEKR